MNQDDSLKSALKSALKSDDINSSNVAEILDLEAHVEGGFFRRTYESTGTAVSHGGIRQLMTSIFYMLTKKSPIGHWHLNTSDIVHYYHMGNPIEYMLIHPCGTLEVVTLGTNIHKGEMLQLSVKGDVWKSSRLLDGTADFGLISEAVSPGFDYSDMTLGSVATLATQFPQHESVIRARCKS